MTIIAYDGITTADRPSGSRRHYHYPHNQLILHRTGWGYHNRFNICRGEKPIEGSTSPLLVANTPAHVRWESSLVSTFSHMHKLYCYVDESGQDTVAQPGQIRIFIIAVAVFETNRAELEQACEAYEVKSGKGKRKWNHCNPESRRNYIRMVVDDRRFQGGLCYFQSDPPRQPEFDACTITGIAKAIQWKQHDLNYTQRNLRRRDQRCQTGRICQRTASNRCPCTPRASGKG